MAGLLADASCGPVNPLAQLSKTFQRDRSLQQVRRYRSLRCLTLPQDRIGANAGPSQTVRRPHAQRFS